VAAEERARQEEEARQAALATARAAEEERQALNKQRHMFIVRAEGRAAIAKAKAGLMTDGRIQMPASVEVSAEAANVLAGEVGPVVRGTANLADAEVCAGPRVSSTGCIDVWLC
jgi:hypothetical protein